MKRIIVASVVFSAVELIFLAISTTIVDNYLANLSVLSLYRNDRGNVRYNHLNTRRIISSSRSDDHASSHATLTRCYFRPLNYRQSVMTIHSSSRQNLVTSFTNRLNFAKENHVFSSV